jgi:hypothetical protein
VISSDLWVNLQKTCGIPGKKTETSRWKKDRQNAGVFHIYVSQEDKGVDHEIAGGMPVSVGRCAFFGGTTLIPQRCDPCLPMLPTSTWILEGQLLQGFWQKSSWYPQNWMIQIKDDGNCYRNHATWSILNDRKGKHDLGTP